MPDRPGILRSQRVRRARDGILHRDLRLPGPVRVHPPAGGSHRGRGGFCRPPGFLKAGSAAMKQKELPIKNPGYDLKPYDTLIIGAPTWAGRPSPFIKTFFNTAKNVKGKKAALFITCGGEPREQTKELMTQTLEQVGLKVSEAFLGLQMKKGTITKGEQEVDSFIEMIMP